MKPSQCLARLQERGFHSIFGCSEFEVAANAILCQLSLRDQWHQPIDPQQLHLDLSRLTQIPVVWLLDHEHPDGTTCKVWSDLITPDGTVTPWFIERIQEKAQQ